MDLPGGNSINPFQTAVDIGTSWYDNRVNTRTQHQAQDWQSQEASLARQFANDQAALDRQLQKDFAENGVSMRVTDALNAGVHPLAALGMNPMNASPSAIGVSAPSHPGFVKSDLGQNIARALSAGQTPVQKIQEMLQLKQLEATISESDARKGYYDAMAARAIREAASIGVPVPKIGGELVKPDLTYSRDAGDTSKGAGSTPAWKSTEVLPGLFLDFPYSPDEGPWEGLDGFWNAILFGAKNFIYNPGAYLWKKAGKMDKWIEQSGRPNDTELYISP